ncbi:MAG: hypothetical protein EAZ12_02305 [Sphingobacteriia bacterium]|nr:MAG: hypothetical protein EAZ12_02305 [Sphingobacteriia bacterium]
MSTLTTSIDFSLKYKVADFSLADWGRKEIQLADFYLSAGLKDSCELELAKIDAATAVMPGSNLRTELSYYSIFKRYMLAITNAKGVLEGLNQAQADSLRYFAQTAIGAAQNQPVRG